MSERYAEKEDENTRIASVKAKETGLQFPVRHVGVPVIGKNCYDLLFVPSSNSEFHMAGRSVFTKFDF